MKVFITGGAGFVGSHIADVLLARGDEVLVIDNFSTGRRDNLVEHKNLRIVEDSIANAHVVEELISSFKPEVVVHTAASYKDPENWEEDSLTNVAGTANVVKSCKNNNVSRVIYFQTALCYGLKPQEQPVTLNHPILPGGSSYAISKTAAEFYVELSGLDYVTFRLANAYGPRNISGPLPTFFKRITEDKGCFVTETRRDFVYIDDMVNCIIKSIDCKGQGAYHLSSGGDYAIKELFDETIATLGVDVDVDVRARMPDDVFSILLDPSRTNKDFDWKPEVSLKKGVKATIEYYQKHGIAETFTHLKQEEKSAKTV